MKHLRAVALALLICLFSGCFALAEEIPIEAEETAPIIEAETEPSIEMCEPEETPAEIETEEALAEAPEPTEEPAPTMSSEAILGAAETPAESADVCTPEPEITPAPEITEAAEHTEEENALLAAAVPVTVQMKTGKNGTYRLAIGETLQLSVSEAIQAGWKLTSAKSSKSSVASIAGTGIVTAKKAGTATITVTMKKGKTTLRGTVTIAVYDPKKAVSVSLNQTGTVTLPLGSALQLTTELLPSTAVSKLSWQTSSKKIAKVSASGLVTPVKQGACTITVVTDTLKKASVKIKVVAAGAAPAPTATPAPEAVSEEQALIADLSYYNGRIDWAAASEILDFAIFRASVGAKADTQYVYNATNCQIPFGVYHYVKAGTVEEAVEEAKFFYQCATQSGISPRFFVADVEYESQNSENTALICQAFLTALKALGAEQTGLYIGQYSYPYLTQASKIYDFLWLPRYGKDDGTAQAEYQPLYSCDLWQYTSVGYVPGITGNVDLNLLTGNKALSFFTGKIKTLMASKKTVVITSSSLNIRAGAGTSYTILKTASKGDSFEAVLNASGSPIRAENGWYAVRCGNIIGWVSDKYTALK